MSQNRQILRHLRYHGSITPMDALKLYGVFRLASRIYELRKTYPKIKSETVIKGKKHYSRYRLVA